MLKIKKGQIYKENLQIIFRNVYNIISFVYVWSKQGLRGNIFFATQKGQKRLNHFISGKLFSIGQMATLL